MPKSKCCGAEITKKDIVHWGDGKGIEWGILHCKKCGKPCETTDEGVDKETIKELKGLIRAIGHYANIDYFDMFQRGVASRGKLIEVIADIIYNELIKKYDKIIESKSTTIRTMANRMSELENDRKKTIERVRGLYKQLDDRFKFTAQYQFNKKYNKAISDVEQALKTVEEGE